MELRVSHFSTNSLVCQGSGLFDTMLTYFCIPDWQKKTEMKSSILIYASLSIFSKMLCVDFV